jgi:imidazolonepropionase-like amidohydrolase
MLARMRWSLAPSVRSVPLASLAPFALTALLAAQGPPHNGPRPVDPGWFAFTGGKVVRAAGQAAAEATVVVRDGRIVAVEPGGPPPGATVVDCTGLVLYPGLIEPWYPSDVPALDPARSDQHWNPMVQPQRDARDGALVPAADREALRKLGFAVAAAVPSGGILKGTAAVVLLDEPSPTAPVRIVRDRAFAAASLQTSRDGYPDSEMGAVALLRQSLADGQWFDRCRAAVASDAALAARAPQPSAALQALADQRALPLWCDAQDELQALRLLAVAAEFERPAVVVGSGMEFRRLAAIAATKAAFVVPLAFPDAPDVATAAAAERASLRQLQSWEQAPTNSKRLLDAGVTLAWTTARLRDRKDFAANVREAIACGVTADEALAALTTVPAQLLGIDALAGSLAAGKLANLVLVAGGGLFDDKAEVREVWVGGVRHVLARPKDEGLDGAWAWAEGWPGGAAASPPAIAIDGDKLTCALGDAKLTVTAVQRDGATLTCRLAGKDIGMDGEHWLRLFVASDGLRGAVTTPDGRTVAVRCERAPKPADAAETPKDGDGKTADADGKGKDAAKPARKPTPPSLDPLPTPLGGYGFAALPDAAPFAIVGATLWTAEAAGIVRDGALVAQDGRIVYAGPRAGMPPLPPGTTTIDGKGLHVTPGLIDCHSHTGIRRGVNESGQAVTAEVRIADVLDPDDVSWYRQLAGGVTAVNQLHGSANAIGGQSQTTKVRYGVANPEDMHFAGAQPGMKWALGENPRGANGPGGGRYPQTRMGVEALIRDRIAAAIAWRREQDAYEALVPFRRAAVLPPRRDLELEAMAEIVGGRRWIHCHSYRQDEIFMLCRLKAEHGAMRIGTFQHVLEGYKVADAIAKAGAGASSFSDWWGYKFEVFDAIADNAAILHEQGVLVSINSDSDEHARRLNTEAAKAVKYGRVAPHEALMFVTANPAKQLGVFAQTGSLTAGKDADVALWSADPLSYDAICTATWVDGRQLFSRARDAECRVRILQERTRLLQRAAAGGGKGRAAKAGDPKDGYWAAEDLTEDYCCRNLEGGR